MLRAYYENESNVVRFSLVAPVTLAADTVCVKVVDKNVCLCLRAYERVAGMRARMRVCA